MTTTNYTDRDYRLAAMLASNMARVTKPENQLLHDDSTVEYLFRRANLGLDTKFVDLWVTFSRVFAAAVYKYGDDCAAVAKAVSIILDREHSVPVIKVHMEAWRKFRQEH